MDEYSFISENGTVRQIRDLVAEAKDEEQDARLDYLEQSAIIDTYSETETQTNKRWIDGKPIYRRVLTGISFGAAVSDWTYTGVTLSGAVTLVSAIPLRKYASFSDQLMRIALRIMPDGRLMFYTGEEASPRINMVIVEYVKA